MPIVDPFGRPVRYSHKVARGAERSTAFRPWEAIRNESIEDLVPPSDRVSLASASRRLYLNMGIARGAIDSKAMFAVGRGWKPVFTGADREWGAAAESWLLEKWYPLADVRGPGHDFQTSLYLDSVAIDRDGDIFILLSQTERGFPQIQHLPSHRVGQRRDDVRVVESGPYSGLKIRDGVIRNAVGRPVAYRVLGEARDGSEDQDISARDLLHLYDPSWHESGRGLPALTHAISDLRDMLTSQEWEAMALLQLSSLGLIEYNELGMADPNDPATSLIAGTDATDGITSSIIAGGTVRYFRSNSGSKIETVDSQRPSDCWDRFWDRLTRAALAGINWPYSLAWKPAELTGTSQRAELLKAQSAVEDRQDVIRPAAKRLVSWAVAKAIKAGDLPKSKEWYKWSFTLPPKLSIDPGRDSAAGLDQWRAGLKNAAELVGERGRVLEDHYRERAMEVATRKRVAREVAEETGEEIDPQEMGMLSPNAVPGDTPAD